MKITLTELEDAAKALQVNVTYEDLKTSKGGSCRVMETRRIIINKHLHANEKLNILARELARFDLGGLDLSERVRQKIRQQPDQTADDMKLSA